MNLEHLGYNPTIERLIAEHNLGNFTIGRVIAEHKERYVVGTANGDVDAEITGHLRFSAKGREDFPAVGDWVALTVYDSHFAIIHTIVPRFSTIKRQAVGHVGEVQLIATNIDCAFLVQAADRDFNLNRLERYLTICNSAGVDAVIVLTKTDLTNAPTVSQLTSRIQSRIPHVPIITLSNTTHVGIDALLQFIEKGKTYCMLGSSGVGKSSLLNNLMGKEQMKTDAISQSTHKGRHITSHRELVVMKNGGILIDNPGMREVGIADADGGLESTFDMIAYLSPRCKFSDCTHTTETGCAVIAAVDRGEIDPNAYDNYLRMEREKAHFESTVAERRRKEKEFGKILKNYKKEMPKNK